MFRTWQGRLPQELAKENITTLESANNYIKNIFLPKMNQLFIRKSASKESGFIPYIGRDINEILSVQTERLVNKDNTVSYKNILLQLPESQYGEHYVKSKMMVHEYEDGILEIFYGPRKIARFNTNNLNKKEVIYENLENTKLAA